MKMLSYSGESVLTSDRVGDAVVDYAQALAAHNAAAVIEIPVADALGRSTARLLIGPSSQILSVRVHDAEVDLEDDDAVATLLAKIRELTPGRMAVSNDDGPRTGESELDFL
jgi:hypothetical protein